MGFTVKTDIGPLIAVEKQVIKIVSALGGLAKVNAESLKGAKARVAATEAETKALKELAGAVSRARSPASTAKQASELEKVRDQQAVASVVDARKAGAELSRVRDQQRLAELADERRLASDLEKVRDQQRLAELADERRLASDLEKVRDQQAAEAVKAEIKEENAVNKAKKAAHQKHLREMESMGKREDRAEVRAAKHRSGTRVRQLQFDLRKLRVLRERHGVDVLNTEKRLTKALAAEQAKRTKRARSDVGGFGVSGVAGMALGSLGGAGVAAAGTFYAGTRVTAAGHEGAKIQAMEASLLRDAEAVKVLDEMMEQLHGTVSKKTALGMMNLARTMKIPMDMIPTMAATARASALTLGEDMDHMLHSMFLGTARESRLILDNLGIIISESEAHQKYAESVGKAVSTLTDAEKRIAFTRELLTKSTEIIAAAPAASALDEMDRSYAAIADSWDRMKVAIVPIAQGLMSMAESVITIGMSPGRSSLEKVLATGPKLDPKGDPAKNLAAMRAYHKLLVSVTPAQRLFIDGQELIGESARQNTVSLGNLSKEVQALVALYPSVVQATADGPQVDLGELARTHAAFERLGLLGQEEKVQIQVDAALLEVETLTAENWAKEEEINELYAGVGGSGSAEAFLRRYASSADVPELLRGLGTKEKMLRALREASQEVFREREELNIFIKRIAKDYLPGSFTATPQRGREIEECREGYRRDKRTGKCVKDRKRRGGRQRSRANVFDVTEAHRQAAEEVREFELSAIKRGVGGVGSFVAQEDLAIEHRVEVLTQGEQAGAQLLKSWIDAGILTAEQVAGSRALLAYFMPEKAARLQEQEHADRMKSLSAYRDSQRAKFDEMVEVNPNVAREARRGRSLWDGFFEVDGVSSAEKEIALSEMQRDMTLSELGRSAAMSPSEVRDAKRAADERHMREAFQATTPRGVGGIFETAITTDEGTDERAAMVESLDQAIEPSTILAENMNSVTDAFADAGAAAILYGDNVADGVNRALNSIAREATARALFETGAAAASWALGPIGAPMARAHMRAAATFGLVAGVTALGAHLTGGINDGSESKTEDRGAQDPRAGRSTRSDATGSVTYYISYNGFTSDRRGHAELVNMMNSMGRLPGAPQIQQFGER